MPGSGGLPRRDGRARELPETCTHYHQVTEELLSTPTTLVSSQDAAAEWELPLPTVDSQVGHSARACKQRASFLRRACLAQEAAAAFRLGSSLAAPPTEVVYKPPPPGCHGFGSYRIGEALHPGPGGEQAALAGTTIESVNITSLKNNWEILLESKAGVYIVQEHSVMDKDRGWLEAAISKAGYKALLSDVDPELQRSVGGVGLICSKEIRCAAEPMSSPELQLAHKTGRAMRWRVALQPGAPSVLLGLYGWSGAVGRNLAQTRTEALVQGLLTEIRGLGQIPCFLMGDLNGDIDTFPSLRQALVAELLFDVGELWARAAGTEVEGTCRAQGAARLTRRDYVFANAAGWRTLRGWELGPEGRFSVHRALHVTIGKPDYPTPSIVSRCLLGWSTWRPTRSLRGKRGCLLLAGLSTGQWRGTLIAGRTSSAGTTRIPSGLTGAATSRRPSLRPFARSQVTAGAILAEASCTYVRTSWNTSAGISHWEPRTSRRSPLPHLPWGMSSNRGG